MGEIKSALELALERTSQIKSDPGAVRAYEAKNRGKRLFAALREDPKLDLGKAIKSEPKDERRWVQEGLFEVIDANLTLPSSERDLATVDLVVTGLSAVINDRGTVKTLGDQIRQFFSQYLDDRKQLIEGLQKQYAPRLREREQQMAKQYGRPVRIDPATDPEFGKALQDNLGRLQSSYASAFVQVREQLRGMFERSR